jgi:hypothetical protein
MRLTWSRPIFKIISIVDGIGLGKQNFELKLHGIAKKHKPNNGKSARKDVEVAKLLAKGSNPIPRTKH